MSRVFWDTNLFVYLLEDKEVHAEQVAALYRRTVGRGDVLFTSTLAIGEILVKPVGNGDDKLVLQYRREIERLAEVRPFDVSAALIFAEIRQDNSIRIPDALQLACASAGGADVFVTNDLRLSRKTVRGIRSIQSLDTAAGP